MPTINELTSLDTPSAGDLFPIYSQTNGDARKLSLTNLTNWLQENYTAIDTVTTQYAAPSATGFSISVVSGGNVWLIIKPDAGYANGTIILPDSSGLLDHQEIQINCTQSVASLTVDGNGATVTGAPSSLAANGYFKLKYDAVMTVWYRIA